MHEHKLSVKLWVIFGLAVLILGMAYIVPLFQVPKWQIERDDPCADWMNRNWRNFDTEQAMLEEYKQCVNYHVERSVGQP